MLTDAFKRTLHPHQGNVQFRSFWQYIHIDIPLLMGIILLLLMGLLILYSASAQDLAVIERQAFRIGLSLIVMFIFAQIPPVVYQHWALWLYIVTLFLLMEVRLKKSTN